MKFKIKSAKVEPRNNISFDSVPGGLQLQVYEEFHNKNYYFDLSCWSGGNLNKSDYYKQGTENYEEMLEISKELMPQLEQICSEFDEKIKDLMKKYGFEQWSI